MLILQRSIGQSIYIGGNIKVICLGMINGGVTIGIEAPKDVAILRSEILINHLCEKRGSRTRLS
jgi:carbon storage regulator